MPRFCVPASKSFCLLLLEDTVHHSFQCYELSSCSEDGSDYAPEDKDTHSMHNATQWYYATHWSIKYYQVTESTPSWRSKKNNIV